MSTLHQCLFKAEPDLIQKMKVYAARRRMSMSELIRTTMEEELK